MKQTAVEFLESRIKVLIPDDIGSQLMFNSNVSKAKEMEREDSKCIPYQLCPKCNGDGNLLRYNPPFMMSTTAAATCDVCYGNKIILMYRGK